MAQPQLTLNPFSGSENEIFRQLELLLRSILAVAALPANQQANFSTNASSGRSRTIFPKFASGKTSKFGTFHYSSSRPVL